MTERWVRYKPVRLAPVEHARALVDHVWQWQSVDPLWPRELYSLAACERLVNDMQTAELIAAGCIRQVLIGREVVGYIVVNLVPEHLAPGTTAVECGTYIAPPWRGTGLNQQVKHRTRSLVRDRFQADWMLFVIPVKHPAALRALSKTGWPLHVETTAASGPFHRYLRRRNFEAQAEHVLCAVRLELP